MVVSRPASPLLTLTPRGIEADHTVEILERTRMPMAGSGAGVGVLRRLEDLRRVPHLHDPVEIDDRPAAAHLVNAVRQKHLTKA